MIDEEPNTLRHVVWKEVFPWWSIGRCFRLAIGLRVLVLSALGVTFSVIGWALFGWIFAGDETLPRLVPHKTACPWTSAVDIVPDEPGLPFGDSDRPRVPKPPSAAGLGAAERFQPEAPPLSRPGQDESPGVLGAMVHRPFAAIFGPDTTLVHLLYLLLCGLWGLAVWAFFGAAITRLVGVRLACDESKSLGACLKHARTKWGSYFAAPLFPLIGVLLFAVPVLLLGLLLRFGAGVWLAALLWPLALLAGFVMAVLLLGLLFGWPLMWPTISIEGTDSFDALSRSYSYVFGRPLHYLFYVLVAAVIGGLGWLLVSNFAAGVIALTYWAASWGSGGNPAIDLKGVEGVGAGGAALLHFWVDCVKLLAVSYLYAYFWTASTAIYLLLRRDVDATEMDEVYLEEEEEQTYGLPPLKTDEAGAPAAADASPPPSPPLNQQE